MRKEHESAYGQRQRETIERILGTREETHTVSIRPSDFSHPYGTPPEKMEGDIYVLVGGKEPEPFTDMDWDMAINEPHRLDKRYPTPAHTIFKLHIVMDSKGHITSGQILKKIIDKKIIEACYSDRFHGPDLDKCLKNLENDK